MKRWGPRLFVRSFSLSVSASLSCVVLCCLVLCCRLFPIHNKRTCSAVTTNFKEPLRAPPAKGAAYLLKTANFFVQDCSAAGPCHHIPSSLPPCPLSSVLCALCSVLISLTHTLSLSLSPTPSSSRPRRQPAGLAKIPKTNNQSRSAVE